MIVLVLDNGGFAVINKLQNNTGNESFNNLFADCPTIPDAFAVDFASHAAAMGANRCGCSAVMQVGTGDRIVHGVGWQNCTTEYRSPTWSGRSGAAWSADPENVLICRPGGLLDDFTFLQEDGAAV